MVVVASVKYSSLIVQGSHWRNTDLNQVLKVLAAFFYLRECKTFAWFCSYASLCSCSVFRARVIVYRVPFNRLEGPSLTNAAETI